MSIDDKTISWPGWETGGLIGRGSFGAVYEIQRDIFGDIEKAALKVISIPQNESDIDEMYSDGYDEESITSTFQSHLKSIVAEYSLMRKMNGCTNIVNCDDVRYVRHDDGIGWDIFIKMELLTPLIKALPTVVPEETVIKIAKDICTALELCKKHEIVHRDIKPQNIFVSPNGDYKLGDFGIAKTVEKTMGGTKIGTYKYMAPEVYSNKPYGSAADIYSLGLVLYWLLNERRMPFLPLPPAKLSAGMDETARTRRLTGEVFEEPKHGCQQLKAIVMKACAYRMEDRYASATEMLRDLRQIGQEPSPMVEEPVVEQSPKFVSFVPVSSEGADDETVGIFGNKKEAKVSAPVKLDEPPEESHEIIEPVVIEPVVVETVEIVQDTNQQEIDNFVENSPTDSSPKKEKNKNLLIFIGIVAALLVAIFVLSLSFGKDTNKNQGGQSGETENVANTITQPETVTVTGISIQSNPDKTEYFVGETLNTTGLSLKVTYSDGSTKTISSGFTCSPTTLNSAGTQTITVNYGGKSTSFTGTVKEATVVTEISVQNYPYKRRYFVGEILNTTGLSLKVTYSDGSSKTISSGFTCKLTRMDIAGTYTIRVSYSGKSTSFTVTVEGVSVIRIAVQSTPNKTEYFVGETLNTAGLSLKATYSDGSTKTITSGFTCNPTSLSSAGTKTITVSYSGKSATFNVIVTYAKGIQITETSKTVEQPHSIFSYCVHVKLAYNLPQNATNIVWYTSDVTPHVRLWIGGDSIGPDNASYSVINSSISSTNSGCLRFWMLQYLSTEINDFSIGYQDDGTVTYYSCQIKLHYDVNGITYESVYYLNQKIR